MAIDDLPGKDACAESRRRERQAIVLIYAAVGADIAGLLWLGVRADSPPWMRMILDFLSQVVVGGVITAAAFRFLLLYPFRILDLLLIVIMLSLTAKFVLDQFGKLSAIGLIRTSGVAGENIGAIVLVCTIAGSILMAGAAIGLRTCHKLKIERPLDRALAVSASMLSLPASAGSIAFGVLLAMAAAKPGSFEVHAPFVIGLWFVSLAITFINVRNFGRMLTLGTEITAKEKLPK